MRFEFSDDEYSVSDSGVVTQISKIPLSALQRTGVFFYVWCVMRVCQNLST